jgi:LacI family transcriptional regulator
MPVTMREVAARAKVSVATVCKSLQNAPTIPLKTRNAVAKVAAEMGYRPHPYVSALMQARRQRAAPGRPPPLAFITAYETADAWKRQPTPFLTLVYAGAKERAEQRGYPLSHFWLHQDNMGNRRLSEVLHTRGVRGILLPPMPRPDKKIDLVWPYFSVVSVGAQLDRPVFHGTANDHYHSMQLALQACWRCGCRSPGFAVDQWVNQRIDRRWEAAFELTRKQYAFGRQVPPLLFPRWNPTAIARWIKREKPDVVISVFSETQVGQLKEQGIRIPEDVGIVSLSVHAPESPLSGVRQHAKKIGAVAVDQLISLVDRNETGIPEHPTSLTMKGTWNVGRTLRNAGSAGD